LLDNLQLSELMALQAAEARPPANKALRRAARRAYMWNVEAARVVEEGRSLTELPAVGPYIAKWIGRWLEQPPAVPVPPDIRSHFLSLTEARKELTRNPSWLNGIRGDLQMHTHWSDGSGSIDEMAEAATERGYEYIAITDHSQGLKIANGLSPAELQRQGREIDNLNDTLRRQAKKLFVLRSIEMNLNPKGEGDMETGSLRDLDIVLGCFHSSLRKKDDQTERYLAALRNPAIQILGHPRGRIYNYRLGLTADWERIFGLAAELDKAVEIDGYPDRQDLSIPLLKVARKAGCRISLGTDAHGPGQLGFMEFAAAAALRAKIPRERILNFMSRAELTEWAARHRG
jgi:histidinol phosphatase-like PHP family hydrolase